MAAAARLDRGGCRGPPAARPPDERRARLGRGGRDPTELYRGPRLAAAADWSDAHAGDLNALEHEFVAASRAHAAHEAERQRRANRRLRATVAGIAVLLAAAVVAGGVALSQRAAARRAAVVADAQRLGAEALTDDRVDRGLLLARAGTALDDSVATRSSLLSQLLRPPRRGRRPARHRQPPERQRDQPRRPHPGDRGQRRDRAARQPDDAPARRAAAACRRRARLLLGRADARLATTSGARELTVDLVDVASGRVRRHLDLGPAPAVTDPQVSPLFGPRDRELVIADVSADGPGGPPTQLRRYDLGRGAWVGGWRRFGGHTARVARSPNRRWLVVSDARARRAYVLDAATLAVRHIARGDFEPAIDSTGERIAEGSHGRDACGWSTRGPVRSGFRRPPRGCGEPDGVHGRRPDARDRRSRRDGVRVGRRPAARCATSSPVIAA